MDTTLEHTTDVLDEHDAALAQAAQRCLMAALDHSRAAQIQLVNVGSSGENAPLIELPPKVLRLVAELLGIMAQQKPVAIVPSDLELTTQEAASYLNVSRPFVIKEIESGKLSCRKVGRHRRIAFEQLQEYKRAMNSQANAALDKLAEQAQALNLGY